MTTSSRSPWSLFARTEPSVGPVPDTVPVLSRGRHRSARKGACFMEMASWLAGEKWSDHPACTHALLATTARSVNDHVGDDARARIVPLIPDVIGLRPTAPRLDAEIARDAALLALPVASASRQRVAAVGLLRCRQTLNLLDGLPLDDMDAETAAALDLVPAARDWARRFSVIGETGRDSFAKRGAPAIVHSAVVAIAQSTARDPDTMLVGLLERTIERCRAAVEQEGQAASAASSASTSTPVRERLPLR
ncbi:hypothetical protein GCM10011519_14690 [Marmoricola endophyticus]|uniref:Uncharacterized protein n=1 Tax=Marmoricola endophyticus TaxID=2040280 RepID=A0A917BG95_9ACTN|nr:hypothetical protein [Marmoricola endophyticus]GGF41918.1 hypothetical protein GCM10011519_14690 [Marmoricola endophyticus]